MTQVPTPATTPATADPGDDTARRFAYQWTFAAILACGLFDDTMDVVEVFCEHHEDVLLKHRDQTFSGWQVKTREVGGDAWKATDESIFGACCRFTKLEQQFPGRFREFVLATNHTFVTNRTTKTCLPHLLSLATEAPDENTAPEILRQLLRKLAAKAECSQAVALASMKKCRCNHELPKLDHIKQQLVNTLVESWPGATEAAMALLVRAADAIIAECQRASSLDHAQTLPQYLVAAPNPVEAALQARITGKRFDRQRVEGVLRAALVAPALLAGPAANGTPPPAGSRSRLERKLAAGGFSPVSINSAQDLRDKADYQSLEWIGRLGDREGLRRRDHIRSVVLRDCAEVFEASKADVAPFGVAMRNALTERLRRRREQGGAPLFDCLDEHLEGYAYGLTSECQVWWSHHFPIEEQG